MGLALFHFCRMQKYFALSNKSLKISFFPSENIFGTAKIFCVLKNFLHAYVVRNTPVGYDKHKYFTERGRS